VLICQFNILLSTSKPSERGVYMGAGLAVQAVLSGAAPLVGGEIMNFGRAHFGMLTAYHILFGVHSFFRLLPLFFLARVRERGSEGIRSTLSDLRRMTPARLRILRRLDSQNPVVRATALKRVAALRLGVAREAVLRAAEDPYPEVRLEAENALAALDEGVPTESEGKRVYTEGSLEGLTKAGDAEAAYLWGASAESEDLPAILACAGAQESVAARRRALLGAARVLDVESQAYKLFMLDDLARDVAVTRLLRRALRRHSELRVALGKFSEGKEAEALAALNEAESSVETSAFADAAVQESFLVVAAWIARK
jgi:hypothetical protein